MNRRKLLIALPGAALAAGSFNLARAGIDVGGMLGAASDAAKAATLTDQQVRDYAAQMAKHMDAKAPVAPSGNPYAQRLTALSLGLSEDQGLKLNYKVYLTREVNAFAMA